MTATPIKRPRGHPSDFNETLAARIMDLAEKGKTDAQIAKAIGVTTRTLHNWKSSHPDFFHALKDAKAVADELVEISLYQRACGYSHREVKVFCYEGEIVTTEVTKHYPPDPASMIFWLKNRQKDRWRDQPKDDAGGKSTLTLTIEDAKKILNSDFATQPDEPVHIEEL